jgi:hypothetical protein
MTGVGSCRRDNHHTPTKHQELLMAVGIVIDIACRAVCRAACADASGSLLWNNARFRACPEDLAVLWLRFLAGEADITIVMETTRNAKCPKRLLK